MVFTRRNARVTIFFLQFANVMSSYYYVKKSSKRLTKCNQYEFSTSTVYKNVVENFVVIALLYKKKLMILIKVSKL